MQPTMNYGNSCASSMLWVGRCNYDGAYETLQHIYGNLKVMYHCVLQNGKLLHLGQR